MSKKTDSSPFDLTELVNKKIRDIIVYFTFKTKYVTNLRLMKLIYIAEKYSCELQGKRLTNATFLNYNYGPWSPDISQAGEILSGHDIVLENDKTTKGYDACFFKPNVKQTTISLSEKEKKILDLVIEDWGYKKTSDIIEYTKSTEPFISTEFDEIIDLKEYCEICINRSIEEDENLIKALKKSIDENKKGMATEFSNKKDLLKHLQSL